MSNIWNRWRIRNEVVKDVGGELKLGHHPDGFSLKHRQIKSVSAALVVDGSNTALAITDGKHESSKIPLEKALEKCRDRALHLLATEKHATDGKKQKMPKVVATCVMKRGPEMVIECEIEPMPTNAERDEFGLKVEKV